MDSSIKHCPLTVKPLGVLQREQENKILCEVGRMSRRRSCELTHGSEMSPRLPCPSQAAETREMEQNRGSESRSSCSAPCQASEQRGYS